jgi:ABC-2 type transport system ATP-binding protein
LKKSYGSHDVLHAVEFAIEAGKLVGFLGPNGAGKTTTIRILLGLLQPNSGSATIFGKSSQTAGKSIRHEVGYLPGDVHFYGNLTGRRTLQFLSNARRRDCTAEFNRLAGELDLELNKRVRKYSTGMRQKLGLIQALMHKPQLLILDEPTSSLDPLIRKTVFDELRNVVGEGRTVLFSSHSLSEVEELCDEVIILRAGSIVEQRKIESLKNRALRRVRIVFSSAVPMPAKLPAQLNVLEKNGRSLVGTWTGKSGDLIQWLSTLDIDDLIIEKPDLSDLFLTYYQDQMPGE